MATMAHWGASGHDAIRCLLSCIKTLASFILDREEPINHGRAQAGPYLCAGREE